MKRITPYHVFQFLGTLTGLTGFILNCFRIEGIIRIMAGSLICLGFAVNSIVWILYFRRKKVVYGRELMMERGNMLIRGTKNKAVLYGGDLSWAKDYKDSIGEIVGKGKEVLVVFPISKKEKASVNIYLLEHAGAKVVSTGFDTGLRLMIIDPDNAEDTLVYLTNRVFNEKYITNQSREPHIYTSEIFHSMTDKVIVNTFVKIYNIVNTILEQGNKSLPE